MGAPVGAGRNASVIGWLGATFAGLILTVAVGTEERMPIVLPILAVTGSAAAFCWWLWRQSRDGFPYFEIGVVYVAVVWLYTVFPLVGFLVNGLRQTPANDMRLYLFRPSAGEVGSIGWYQAAHLAAFVATYLLWRGRVRPRETGFPVPDRATVVAALFAYLVIGAYLLFLDWRFDLSAKTYLESYLVTRRLPLEFAQLANHLGAARFVLELLILAALFGGYPRWRSVILGWMAVVAGLAFIRRGSRTDVVMLMAAVAVMYDQAVRRLRLWHVAVCGVIGLSFFLVLGVLRYGTTPASQTANINPIFGYASEFENNLANAYDLSRLRAKGLIGDLPVAFYLADLLALVPQQLLPVEKISPAVWYVNTFYPIYAATGGGLAFGSIAESVLGGGWVDAAGRGAALGLLLAQVHRYHARSGATVWSFIFYVWATVSVYHSFRATTFVLVGYFFYRFLPVAIGVKVLASVLRAMPRTRVTGTQVRFERAG
jgi:hypothetical protein